MSDDPYKVLGVGKSASDEEIKKAYRKLAKEHHPDLKPGDKAAEERFKAISAAFNILGDADKRRRFDAGEIDASGAERPEQQFYRRYAEAGAGGGGKYQTGAGFEDLGDIFSDLFGGGGGRHARAGGGFAYPGADARYQLEADFIEAAQGGVRRVTMPDGRALDITIPAGLHSGQTLRLKGKGGPGVNGGPAGDAYVTVTVRPHSLFRREGDDIAIDLPVTLQEAVLGAKVKVPTVSGAVNVTVPAGASSGQTLRLRGKGIKRRGAAAGDQLVRLKLVLPDVIDDELKAFIEKWGPDHLYDPRAGWARKP